MFTHVLTGKNGAGPIKLKPIATNIVPIIVITFGVRFLSHNQPNAGAVAAYVPPLMTNIKPNMTGDNANCRKCGSNVACKKPIDILVTIILKADNKTPGIFKALYIDAKVEERK